MLINLSPQVRFDTLAVSRSGNVLTINGEEFDFSVIPDGATVPGEDVACEYIIGPIERIDGALHLTLLFPIGFDATQGQAFPAPLIDPPDGPLDLPKRPEDSEAEE